MGKGVQLFLEPGTRVPGWVRNQDLNVKIRRERLRGRTTRLLLIRKGEAQFCNGGGVVVKMPGSSKWWGVFVPMKVLEIRDLKGVLIKRNYHLCTECSTLTGRVESYKQVEGGLLYQTFKCTDCGYEWELTR